MAQRYEQLKHEYRKEKYLSNGIGALVAPFSLPCQRPESLDFSGASWRRSP